MTISNNEVIQTTSLYKTYTATPSRLKNKRLQATNSTSGVFALSPASGLIPEFKLIAMEFGNPSRSDVEITYTIPAGGATLYSVNVVDALPFNTVYFGDSGKQNSIVDLQAADIYANLVQPLRTPLSDLNDNDQLTGFYPCRQDKSTNLFPYSLDGLTAGTLNSGTISFSEQQHLEVSATPNTALVVTRRIPFSVFKDTFFAMDKNNAFPTDMYIRLGLNYLTRMCYYTSTPTNPSANITPIAANINATVYLNYKVETNQVLIDQYMGYFKEGKIKMSIPWTTSFSNVASPASNVFATNITLSKQYGKKLKKVTTAPYNARANSNYTYDHSNLNGSKIKSYRTQLNYVSIQDNDLNCYNPNVSVNPALVAWSNPVTFGDDYEANKKYIQGSCIQSYPMYQTMWSHTDDFGVLPFDEEIKADVPIENMDSGLDLTSDVTYSFNASVPGITDATSNSNASGLVIYTFATFTRKLHPNAHVMVQLD